MTCHAVIMKRAVLTLILCLLSVCPLWALSYEKEHQIAGEFLTALEGDGLIIHDEELTWMMQSTLDRLVAEIDAPLYPFQIHLVRDPSVNAFAIPDGHIFINYGTILAARDINELAGVIGHELGHSQLRHMSQSIEANKRLSTASVVGVLAGMLLSAANPEAGQALILSSLGGSQNMSLAYSRRHEYEADRFSNTILPRAGFDPAGMSRFLITLRTLSGGTDLPEYFLTHPYGSERIAILKTEQGSPAPDDHYWRLYATTSGLLLQGSELTARTRDLPAAYQRLARGMAAVRDGRDAEALPLLEGLELSEARTYRGLALFHLGRTTEAAALLKQAGHSTEARLAYAQLLLDQGESARALQVLEPVAPRDPRAAHRLGVLFEQAGQDVRAHWAYAHYFFLTHNGKSCSWHLERALEGKDVLAPDQVARLEQMQRILKKNSRQR